MSHAGHMKKTTRSAGRLAENSPIDRLLLRIVDGGLAGGVFLVPLLMGGRQALGQLALVALCAVVALSWMLRQCIRRESSWRVSSAELLLLAGVALLVLQTAPISSAMLARLAPKTVEILPLWTDQDNSPVSLGTWSCISLTPAVTRAALSIFLAYALLFLVTVQRIQAIEDVERLLRWIALSAVLMAVFGLVQLLTSNDKFFWFYEHPFSRTSDGAKGSFTNRNHFAHFLALGIGPLIWWLQDNLNRRRPGRRSTFARQGRSFQTEKQISGLGTVALGMVLFAGLLSLSRGGVLVIVAASAVCVAVCYRANRLSGRFVLSLGGVALLIGALLAVHGLEQVSDRMGKLSSGSLDDLDEGGGRRAIWGAVLQAIPDFALLGSGVGSHREIYPRYLENAPAAEFTHAENGPLQVLLETGAVGLTLVSAGIGFCGFWCIGGLRKADSSRMLVCFGAISAGLAVSVVHSLADFVWYVPGCMTLVAILAGCACRTWQLAAAKAGKGIRPLALPKPLAVAAAGLLLAAGTWMVANRAGPTIAEPHWDRYRIMALAVANPAAPVPSNTQQQPQDDASPEEIRAASLEAVHGMIAELKQVVRYDPANARAHLELAAAFLRRFDLAQQSAENAMSLADIRDAAARARSAAQNPQQRRQVEQWLSATIRKRGDDLSLAARHTRQGLALCPLQGEGYLYLAELRFLEGPDAEAAKPAYVDQALRVRPFNGAVLFEAGRAAINRAVKLLAVAGEETLDAKAVAQFNQEFGRGLDYWRRSFQSGRRHQERLITALAGRVPVEYIVKTYQPDLYAMRLLRGAYCWLALPEHANHLRRLYADQCRAAGRPSQSADAATAWLEQEMAQLHRYYAQIARREAESREGEEAAKAWLEAAWYSHVSDDLEGSFECARKAYQSDPNNYEVRYTLALRLIEHEQFAEAEDHLKWCSRERPHDEKVRWLVQETVKNRFDKQSRPVYQAETPRTLRNRATDRRGNLF